MNRQRMTIGSCFSGIGGELVAATMMGWDVKFFCEKNPFGRTVLEYWFPNAKSYEDITTTDFSEWRGRVDVLTGGFPCQPFSFAGQRRGAEDDRYLWPYMFRCIDQIRPAWVVAENVAGILTMVEQGEVSQVASAPTLFDEGDAVRGQYRLRETFTLQRICDDLEGHGYSVQPVLVPACAVGAPHRRDRVFIVARRNDAPYPNGTRARDNDGATCDEGRTACEDWRESLRQGHGQTGASGTISASDDDVADTEHLRLQHDAGRGEQAADIGTQSRGGQDVLSEQVQRIATISEGRPTAVPGHSPHPDGDRGSEVHEHMESELADGAKPVSNGGQRNVADTCSDRLQHDDFGGSKIEAFRRRTLELMHASAKADGSGRGIGEYSDHCGERWANFPSVSPVHRGNDGLPFPVDRLTLSFGKWRTEALKAYGNAIVPQVMYEIFRAIEQVENPIKTIKTSCLKK